MCPKCRLQTSLSYNEAFTTLWHNIQYRYFAAPSYCLLYIMIILLLKHLLARIASFLAQQCSILPNMHLGHILFTLKMVDLLQTWYLILEMVLWVTLDNEQGANSSIFLMIKYKNLFLFLLNVQDEREASSGKGTYSIHHSFKSSC